ncbi:uncharacterized protein KY384_001033 [Bacidia gigantensis]|uniref:uncharacterized protein n=1 Tax=Bacidia gigantensis TaxID=2732470 RepID=UPI001D042F6F|nr:uncharacterized protein KY384_001033 [Bacidia gigantensis]KAG8534189.1 hypothetical protein KY384_001033 [Bacidia gigantensis]
MAMKMEGRWQPRRLPQKKTQSLTVSQSSFLEYRLNWFPDVFQIAIKIPHNPRRIEIMVSTQEQVQDLRQTIMETPGAIQYSCFHLEFKKKRINDFIELSEVDGLTANAELLLVEDPYTEKEARMHLLRVREIIGVQPERVEGPYGIAAGLSLHDSICPWKPSEGSLPTQNGANHSSLGVAENALADYSFDGLPDIQQMSQSPCQPSPTTIKTLNLSSWNPPPLYLRQKGHLIYLQLTTTEGEQHQITSHVTGFYVNKCSNGKFDPFPRSAPKSAFAHSLLTLLSSLSTSFELSFAGLLEANSKRDPLVSFQLTNAVPASPWVVSSSMAFGDRHPDLIRTQEAFLLSGPDGNETLRDWNEELQSTRELPRETVQERVIRERLISKTYAEFTDAAVKGALLVARGEVASLNPTESTDAQIFVYNNVFYSFGADGVGTFTSEGGDEAARVAVGKDVMGVKAVNQLDIKSLSTAGTIVVDYIGKRIVAQSIVPGIFRQREPDEHQVDYGGVEGRDVVADNQAFVPAFSQVSKALRIKSHAVWDRDGKRHDLEGSVETKGLLGTDGRKYILDLYRLTPLDISWLETHHVQTFDKKSISEKDSYPHRMAILRPELIESYWRLKMGEYVREQVSKKKGATGSQTQSSDAANPETAIANDDGLQTPPQLTNGLRENPPDFVKGQIAELTQGALNGAAPEHIDISSFTLALNPDVFCGQIPQSEKEKALWAEDEAGVRAVCDYLHQTVFTDLLSDLREGEVGFPMDGLSLSRLLHKRGINIRYLGKLANIADDNVRGHALRALAEQEMIARAFKHEIRQYLSDVPAIFTTSCVAHLLNCLVGTQLNSSPTAVIDESLRSMYPKSNFSFLEVTPEILAVGVRGQVHSRFRYDLQETWIEHLEHIQLTRSIALKIGLQLIAKKYRFERGNTPSMGKNTATSNGNETMPTTNGPTQLNGVSKKKKKGAARRLSQSGTTAPSLEQSRTFHPDDIANIVPIIKDSCPKSTLAEEALEAGKLSIMQNQKDVGQELLLESLTLHEQIYGVLHPEVARVYHQLAMLYFQLDEKAAAIELAHKAVIISERTLGIDSSETVLSYLNLALFEHGNRNTAVAIACVRHALELWRTIYGNNHPDLMTTFNNAAVMLQQLQKYNQSRTWFEKSLNLSEEIAGKSSVNTATLLFQLAQALVLDGDHKGAVQRMREAYSIFLSTLGAEDSNTKESEKWLEQLTQNAVSMAKHAKDVQSKRIRRILFSPRAPHLNGDPQPQIGQAQNALTNSNEIGNTSRLDPRSIEELMKYIEGGGEVSKTPARKRVGRLKPRQTGGARVGPGA